MTPEGAPGCPLKRPGRGSDPKAMTRFPHRLRTLVLALALAALVAPSAPAAEGEICDPGAPTGPVSLLILATPSKVQNFAKTVKGTRVVRRDAKTVVFEDGRVVTSDVGGASAHIEALGWNKRSIDVVATFRKAAPRPRRARG